MAKKKIDYGSLYTLRKDGRYTGSYTDDRGRHFVYDKDPEKLHHKIEKLRNQERPRITFAEVVEAWESDHVEELSRGTQLTYKAQIELAIELSGKLPIEAVDAAEINRVLLKEKQQGYSYKHAATLKSIYKQVLDYAIVKGYINVNPAHSVTVPRGMTRGKREAPEMDAIELVKNNLDKPFGNFVAVLFYTGMRTEEAAALTWADVKEDMIYIRRAVDLHGTPIIKETKTEAGNREVPILPPLKPFLTMPADAKPTDYIFNIDGKLLTRSQITSRWLTWCKAAGLAHQESYDNRYRGERKCTRTEWRPDLTPHQLRHNFATVLYEAGVDELTATDLMGHADISTTRAIYTSLRKKHKQEQIRKILDAF